MTDLRLVTGGMQLTVFVHKNQVMECKHIRENFSSEVK